MKKFNPFKPEQMEEYLSQMHQSGQALQSISPWAKKMTFVPCQAKEMVYRLDIYQPSKKEMGFFPEYDAHYRSYFEDEGWEMVTGAYPYVIWRKPAHGITHADDLLLYNTREDRYHYQKKLVFHRIRLTLLCLLPSFFPVLLDSEFWNWPKNLYSGVLLCVMLGGLSYQLFCLYRLKKKG